MSEYAATFNAEFCEDGDMNAELGEVTRVSTSDYKDLLNKPSINGVTLVDDKSFEELGVETLRNSEILEIFNRVFGG